MSAIVGQFFHSTHENGWQGCVLSEPNPGFYVIETYDWLMGERYGEQLVSVEQMIGWHFYDTNEEMQSAYTQSVAAEWQRAREVNA